MSSRILLLPLLLLQALQGTQAYSSGAPLASCEDMLPQHGHPVQTSEPPYRITPNATSLFGGERIQLRLEPTLNYFEGFLIQGRTSFGGPPVGTFFTQEHKTIDCGGKMSSAVTHKKEIHYDLITVEWEAPSDFEGEVAFRTTVLKGYSTYWTTLCSEKVTVIRRPEASIPLVQSPTLEETNAAPEVQTDVEDTALDNEKLYDGCEGKKTCFGTPSDCVDSKNCTFLTTYLKGEKGEHEFEVASQSEGGGESRYVGVGFSDDLFMGNENVVVCSSKSGKVDIYMTFNNGKSNVNVENSQQGLKALRTEDTDGFLYCRFILDDVTETNDRKVDLNEEKYHLMVAAGPISPDNRLQYHSAGRIVNMDPMFGSSLVI